MRNVLRYLTLTTFRLNLFLLLTIKQCYFICEFSKQSSGVFSSQHSMFMLYIFKHFNICIYISAEIEIHYKTTTVDMCTAEHLFPFLMKINFVSFRFFKWIFNHVTNYHTIKLLFKSQSFRSYRSYFIRLKIIYIHI